MLGAKILPVEIWDPRADIAFAYRHLQPTVCGIVKRAISFLTDLPKGLIDGILVPHTCDSLQNIGTLIKDLLVLPSSPCIFFYPPKGPYKKSSFEYFKKVLKVLQRDLEAFGTQAEELKIIRCLDEMAKVYQVYRKLFELLARDLFPAKNRALLDLIKGFGYLIPDDILEAFDEISKEMSPNKDLGPKVFISGIYPYEVELIEMLDLLKARIVAEDSLFLTRRFPNRTGISEDPYEELAYRYFSTPPCPTKGLDLGERADYLIQRARSANVKGV
ncbi:MAG: 2-hydroxyacyl-CoA dehydratase, partial [Desulfatiglandales bacterium]